LTASANAWRDASPALAFAVLAAAFYLNDFAFIAFNGTYGVYLTDYASRLLVLAVCFAWPVTRAIAGMKFSPRPAIALAIACAALLPVAGRLVFHLIEVPFIKLTGLKGLFVFHHLADPVAYWFDLTVGLFLVALSEELVFRKVARHWLERAGRTPLQIVVISSLLFSLMHWGSGPGRLIYTFVAGAIYMTAYLKIGRLWPLVIAHWIEDFAALGPFDF